MTHLPRGVEWLLRLGLPADQREPIAGDLEEEYAARVRRGEVLRARLAIWWQAAAPRVDVSLGTNRARPPAAADRG